METEVDPGIFTPVQNDCRCGDCCRYLILEVDLADAEREPRISKECGPLKGMDDSLIGYMLNDQNNRYACHFLDHKSNLCTIYETRPLMCRMFCCDEWKREKEKEVELLELGIKKAS